LLTAAGHSILDFGFWILDFGFWIFQEHEFLPCTANPHSQSAIQNLNSGGQSSYGRPYSKYEG
jgi:hypothetical protein